MPAEPWVYAAGGDYAEELAWLTDVLQASAGGVTQTRRLRQTPVVTLDFDTQADSDDRRRMEWALRRAGASQWLAPVVCDMRTLASPAVATTLTFAVDGARFVDGGKALLIAPDRSAWEVVDIDTVGSGSLILSVGVLGAWPAGTQVLPLRAARLALATQVDRFTADSTGIVAIKLRLEEPLEDAPALPTAYRGLPVFDLLPDWAADPAWAGERLTEAVDNGLSAPLVVDLGGVSFDRLSVLYTADSDAGVQALRAALYALAGRWSPAWVPSWAQDLRIVAPVANGATQIDVRGPLLSAGLPTNLRDIRIELASGTVLHRRINAAAVQSSTVDRLTLDSPIVTGFAVSDVRMVSFLRLCAQDADVNLLRYFTPGCMSTEITWRGLAHSL